MSEEQDFFYTGLPETFIVPAGVNELIVFAKSPGIGDDSFDTVGRSVLITGTLSVTPGEKLRIRVGGMGTATAGGFPNGGAPGDAAAGFNATGGNGSTDIRQGGDTLANRVVVAGAPGGYGDGSITDYFDEGPAEWYNPAVIDGGLPDGTPRLDSLSADSATQLLPGVKSVVVLSGPPHFGDPAYHYGDNGTDGLPVISPIVGTGGAGGKGYAQNIVLSDTLSGSIPGPATGDFTAPPGLLGNYESGPITYYRQKVLFGLIPYVIPMWGKISVKVLTATGEFIVAAVHEDLVAGSDVLALSAAGPSGEGGTSFHENLTGTEQEVYVWVYSAFEPGANDYNVQVRVYEGPINPGSGGGGGYRGGGGGSSNTDQGHNDFGLLEPDGRNGQGGGGGSSYSIMPDSDYTDGDLFFDPWGPGLVALIWDVVPFTAVPPIHIPHKEWADIATAEERQNYYNMERFSFEDVIQEAILHFPHKTWASPGERENYLEIERWVISGMSYPLIIPFKRFSSVFEQENYYEIERWARSNFES